MNGRTRRKRRAAAGMTLLELMGYLAVLAIGINLCVSLMFQGWRLSALHAQALDRMNSVTTIEEAFRKAVRASDMVVPGFDDFRTGEEAVVFRGHDADGAVVHTVFSRLGEAEDLRLSKVVLSGTEADYDIEKMTTYSLPLGLLSFSREGRGVSMTLTLALKEGERAGKGMAHRFVATPRGGGEPRNTRSTRKGEGQDGLAGMREGWT